MEFYELFGDKSTRFSFERLTKAYLYEAVKICNECVGENLYSFAYLSSIMNQPNHYFYFLMTPEREIAGYIYFFLTELESMNSLLKRSKEELRLISKRKNPIIGNLQSIGMAQKYRHHKLSTVLVRFYLEQLQTHQEVVAALGMFWKIKGFVPMEKSLTAFDFIYLGDAHRIWYDNKDLICPYCEGRCQCDAAIYYKPLEKESVN